MNNNQYINILGWMINELNLSGNKLILYAIIYGYSQDGINKYKASLSYIENALKISRPTVIGLLKTLVEEGLVEKIEASKKTLPSEYKVVKKFNYSSKETLPPASKETLPNTNNTNNNNTNNKKEEALSIYSWYIKQIDVDKKYHYRSASLLDLENILKEYTKEEIENCSKIYFKGTERKWRKSPRYFFNNSKRSENYRMFENFLPSKEEEEKIRRSVEIDNLDELKF